MVHFGFVPPPSGVSSATSGPGRDADEGGAVLLPLRLPAYAFVSRPPATDRKRQCRLKAPRSSSHDADGGAGAVAADALFKVRLAPSSNDPNRASWPRFFSAFHFV